MSAYIAIRDDAATQSLVERDFIWHQTASTTFTMRLDGRKATERRPVALSLTRAENLATATVTLGAATRATCTVTADLVPPPSADRPNEGAIQFSVDISPSASTRYRQATPAATGGGVSSLQLPNAERHQKLLSNHILRCLERCILHGGALDTEALCVVPGAFVWKLSCCCTILDDGGNLTDATVLACLAAVRHYRKPIVELSATSGATTAAALPQLVPANLKEPTPLPLHHTPLTISFALYDGAATSTKIRSDDIGTIGMLVDPTVREELCETGNVTIGMNVHQEICLLDFSGGCELSLSDVKQCHVQAATHIGPLCQSLETALEQADQKALAERLAQLQNVPLPPLPPAPDSALDDAILTQSTASDVPVDVASDMAAATRDAAMAAEEEAYRRQALDYNLGHMATKVRDDTDTAAAASAPKRSSLLTAMLQSVQGNSGTITDEPTPMVDEVAKQTPPTLADPPKQGKTTTKRSTKPKAAPTADVSMSLDSDEEETTVQLQGEFDTLSSTNGSALETTPTSLPVASNGGDDDDADDLAAAVRTKKKGKKKR